MRKHTGKAHKRGFTIIEVLVVLLITSAIMILGTVRYRDFARRQAVAVAKRQIVSDIRSAQSDAVSGRKPAGCEGALDGYFFNVTGTTAPASYEVYVSCTTGGNTNTVLLKEIELPIGISISMPSVNPINFRPLALGTNIAGGSQIVINISVENMPNTESVTVTSSGEVR